MAIRKDGSFRWPELTNEELVQKLNENSLHWLNHDVLVDLMRRVHDDGDIEPDAVLDDLPIEIVDEWLYELGFEPNDDGQYVHIVGMTDAEVDEWLLNPDGTTKPIEELIEDCKEHSTGALSGFRDALDMLGGLSIREGR